MSNTKGEYGTRCFWCWCSFDFQDIYGNYPTANEKKICKIGYHNNPVSGHLIYLPYLF